MLTGYKDKKFALIGVTKPHLFSTRLNGMLADYEYSYKEVKKSRLRQFMSECDLDGFNVTSPLKRAIIPYLSELTDNARRIGAVTAVVRRDGKLIGGNTDYPAFISLLNKNKIDPAGKKVLVLGKGDTAAAFRAALEDLGADDIVTISRGGENDFSSLDMHDDTAIIVNTTPVGTAPDFTSSPISLRYFKDLEAVIDVVYDPFRTELMLEAEENGFFTVGGLDMLMYHIKASCELFTGRKVTDLAVTRAAAGIEVEMKNIVLVGMPGCGKSVIAVELARALGRTANDTDDEICREAGLSIPEIYELYGEDFFRRKEDAKIKELARGNGAVIACGAGAILREDNIKELRRKSIVVFLRREIERLATSGGAKRSRDALMKLYKERIPLYLAASDVIVDVGETPKDTVRSIVKAIYKK